MSMFLAFHVRATVLLYTGSCVNHHGGILLVWADRPTLSEMQMSQREIGTRLSVTITLTRLCHSVAQPMPQRRTKIGHQQLQL